ncbi:MAG: exodeoxyribonuclease VII large subunit [Clostridiales bacterium]|nr:exodeoxyribonuclease VII large subunit [Clostridiales bacterium]
MEQLESIFSVSELNEYVSLLLSGDRNLQRLQVRGEISGLRRHTSGHIYFSLKDTGATVRCVMFAASARRLTFIPKDGMQVRLSGSADLYARDGSFQLYAVSLTREGEGELYARFLAYKEELRTQGAFETARKKPIPPFPSCVGVVTSPTGAVWQDIRNIAGRRFTGLPLLLYPTAVQGEGAAAEIAAAIAKANREKRADVLIVGRGGGSLEELWAFNEPAVVNAILDSAIPVISAVGHETDVTLADFVADLRAPTPSAAAELAVPERDALAESLRKCTARLARALGQGLAEKRHALELAIGSAAFARPTQRLWEGNQRLDEMRQRLQYVPERALQLAGANLNAQLLRLRGGSVQDILSRGFAWVSEPSGKSVTGARQAALNQNLELHFADGGVKVQVIRNKE